MSIAIQYIPHDVLHLIFYKLADSALEQQREPVVAIPLLGVCRRWREAALHIYCQHVTICSDVDRARFYRARQGLSVNKALHIGWIAFVRRATVIVSSDSLSQGTFQKEIAIIGRVLANVRHARLHIWSHIGQPGATREILIMDIESILISLGYAFPRLQHIELEAIGINQFRKDPTNIHKDAYYVYNKISKACLCSCSLLFPFTIASGLVNLTLELSNEKAQAGISVAVTHAKTLRFLNIRYIRIRDCKMLTSDLNGNPVEYSSLQHLFLDVLGAYDEDELHHRSLLQGVPFPKLEYLKCTGVYPFLDNVLMRRSCRSLQKLVLAVDTAVAGWLLSDLLSFDSQSHVAPYLCKFTKLRFIDLQVTDRFRQGREVVADEINNRIVQMAMLLTQVISLRVTYPNSGSVDYKTIN